MTYFLPGAFLTRWVGKHRPAPCYRVEGAPRTAVGTAVTDGVLPHGSAAAHCRRPRVQDTSTARRRPKFPPAHPDTGGDCLLAVVTATR